MEDIPHNSPARAIAEDLRWLVQRAAQRDWAEADLPGLQEILGKIANALETLEQVLEDRAEGAAPKEHAIDNEGVWSLGQITTSGPRRPIRGGWVEPVVGRRLIVTSPLIIAFLTSLPDGDWLKRERHAHFGWHYHYLDRRRRRSDIVLCWDVRALPPKPELRPLFQEKHGEGGADFSARPDTWGERKRRSVHEACLPDLDRPIEEFRSPANKAIAVWPRGAVLTRPAGSRTS